MGVEVPGYFGLEGVSDADVAIHSIVDAILGALGRGSIGEHFPIKDPLNQDRDSKEFLQYCKDLLEQSCATILNIDVTIVCEEPKIFILADSMKKITASCLGIKESDINVKGKTTEGLGFEGRREGISSYAVATVSIEE